MKRFMLILIIVLATGISTSIKAQHHHGHNKKVDNNVLNQVAAIHEGAGPFAVAGYRMGLRALQELGVDRGSFSVDVTHETPAEVQWSCI